VGLYQRHCDMRASIFEKHQRQRLTRDGLVPWTWLGSVGIAAAVGAAFFLAAKIISWGTAFQPDKVSLFWPPTGVSCGLLIVLDRRRRWPAIAGIVAASALIGHEVWNSPWITLAVAACNALEALTVSELFTRYFGGADFPLDRARNIFGLLGAAAVGAFASSLIATAVLRLSLGPSILVVSTWQHWFASVFVGIVTVTPLVIGLADAVRHPPFRREYVEGTFALLALAVVTSIIVALPREAWEVLLPVAWPFPILLWLAGRSRPIFAAAGAFLTSNIIVWTTIFGIGHFGDANVPLGNRVLEAQAAILFLAVSAYVLAALFAERRESEARLARANAMLEDEQERLAHSNLTLQRERDNKLMTLRAVMVSISHEIKQPLSAIALNGDAARQFLKSAPSDLAKAKSALNDLIEDSYRAGRILDNLRQLFGRGERENEPIDMNDLALSSLQLLRRELADQGVVPALDLATEQPLVMGQKTQLQEVLLNLFQNAIEAMAAIKADRRALKVRTAIAAGKKILIEIEDSGAGIDPERLERIMDAFVTTKAHGTGLGLAICSAIVERHGGQLLASSDGKNGALFKLVLPVASARIDDPRVVL
jgi:signal transduction histidine kinase